ncbi:Low conductance mechanosensitive channel YnaI [Maioricimonas rarisocia]|uniref:Low conductance mechanosensitive channel YnaI n=1 Tax=Maioricimonas rarisocia TaxID=2528026 RepID=A0A517Z204_9PLAN|nr:mechanosensitive ion channel family protein [Maioricimonas rarisocia]QDU36514.1 Low conductance mechanosensitive channel YnaI [Maioricimonas rarisocia]
MPTYFRGLKLRLLIAAVVGIAFCMLPAGLRSQESSSPGPLEPSDTSSPAASLNSLIAACNELHAQINDRSFSIEKVGELLPAKNRILDCLDLSELRNELHDSAGIEAAMFLKEVLDRIELPADSEIPGTTVPEETDGESPLRWQVPRTRIAISRMQSERFHNVYLFTPGTVRRAAQEYRMIKGLPYRTGGRPVSPGLYETYLAITKQEPAQSADTSSPRGTLTLFLQTCNELHDAIRNVRHFDRDQPELHRLGERIVSCLDSSQLPEYAREYFDAEAAVCLKEVLDRVPLPPAEQIPGIESVEVRDGSETLLRWQVPFTSIVIARVQEGPRRGEYLFSAETVARAPEFYQKMVSQPYRTTDPAVSDGLYEWWLSSPGNPTVAAVVDWLPAWFQQRRLGMAIWQGLGLLLITPVSLILMWYAFRASSLSVEQTQAQSLWRSWASLGFIVVAICVPIIFKHVLWEYLTVRGTALYIANFCADVVLLLAVMGLIVVGSSRVAESVISLPHIAPTGLDANLIRIICRVLGITAAIVVFLEGGRYLGFPLTTLIASAGIGGLAIALSAQGLIKGLFGTVTILLDKPFRVGERIVVKGHDGFVEEIGLRSTKIRALTNHVISIPNDQIADAEIENVGRRRCIRRMARLYIPLDTPRAKVEAALKCIRTVLANHQGMDAALPPRVHFTDFTPNAFEIRFMYWYTPPDHWDFLAFSEEVNLQIFRAFEERGIQFSLPFRHSYWKDDNEQGPLEISLEDSFPRSDA